MRPLFIAPDPFYKLLEEKNTLCEKIQNDDKFIQHNRSTTPYLSVSKNYLLSFETINAAYIHI